MKLRKLVSIGALVCLTSIAASAQLLKRTTVKTDSVPFGAGSVLAVTGAPAGDIKIDSSTTGTVEIKATIEVQAGNENDLAGAAALTGFVIQETLGRVGVVSVGADSRRKFTNDEKKLIKRLKGMPYRIDYEIGVPKYCSVEIDGGKGEIRVSGLDGQHKINGVDSDVRVNVSGFLSLTLGKGKAYIELTGGKRFNGIDASVASGDISLQRHRSVSADIDATVLRTGEVFNKDSSLKPRDRKFPWAPKLVVARAGAGGPGIKLTAGDGNVWLLPIVE